MLQGERQAELDQIEAETDIITQLQRKLDELESTIQREKDKVQRAVGIYSTAHVLNALFESTNYIQVYRIQISAEVTHGPVRALQTVFFMPFSAINRRIVYA